MSIITTTTDCAHADAHTTEAHTTDAHTTDKPKKRERRFLGVLPPPDGPTPVTYLFGEQVARVPVYGRHGAGRFMLLDASAWERIRVSHGDKWLIGSRGQVVSSRNAANHGVDQERARPKVAYLTRIVTDAPEDSRVEHLNEDRLDFRAANLLVVHDAETRYRLRQLRLEQAYRKQLARIGE